MSRLIAIAATCLCVSFSGCMQFQHPLSPHEQAQLDREIFGNWYRKGKTRENGKTDLMFLHIGIAGDPPPPNLDRNTSETRRDNPGLLPYERMTRVAVVERRATGRVLSNCWVAYPTRIGKQNYANVPIVENGEIKGYFFWKYELDGDTLTVWTNPGKSEVDELIASEKLNLAPNSATIVAGNTEQLRRALSEGGDEMLFPEQKKMVFHKLKLPE